MNVPLISYRFYKTEFSQVTIAILMYEAQSSALARLSHTATSMMFGLEWCHYTTHMLGHWVQVLTFEMVKFINLSICAEIRVTLCYLSFLLIYFKLAHHKSCRSYSVSLQLVIRQERVGYRPFLARFLSKTFKKYIFVFLIGGYAL